MHLRLQKYDKRQRRVSNFGTLSSLKCAVFEICEQGQRSERDAEDSSRLLLLKTDIIVRIIQNAIYVEREWGARLALLVVLKEKNLSF